MNPLTERVSNRTRCQTAACCLAVLPAQRPTTSNKVTAVPAAPAVPVVQWQLIENHRKCLQMLQEAMRRTRRWVGGCLGGWVGERGVLVWMGGRLWFVLLLVALELMVGGVE